MGGGDWMEQQQIQECNTTKEFYSYLREVKDQSLKDRVEKVFQVSNILLGHINVVIICVTIGAVFHKHVFDFIKKKYFK